MQIKMLLVSSLALAACHGGKTPVAPTTAAAVLQWKLHPLADAGTTGVDLVVADGKKSQTITLAAATGAVMPINQSFCAGTAYPLRDGQLAKLTFYSGGATGYVVEQPAGATELSIYSWSQSDGACDGGKACPEDKKLVTTVPVAAGSKFSETIVTAGTDGTQTPFACK